MEPSLQTKLNGFEELTYISQRVVLSLLKVRKIDVEFCNTTLTVPDEFCGQSEYICASLTRCNYLCYLL
jgi:hypothetical protein